MRIPDSGGGLEEEVIPGYLHILLGRVRRRGPDGELGREEVVPGFGGAGADENALGGPVQDDHVVQAKRFRPLGGELDPIARLKWCGVRIIHGFILRDRWGRTLLQERYNVRLVMSVVNLHFPVLGSTIRADHGYALYPSLAGLLSALHRPDAPVQIGPILGHYTGNGQLQLDPRRSRLRLRLPVEQIPLVLPLAGKGLDIDGHRVRLGVPQVLPLILAPTLIARMVTIKKGDRDKAGSRACMEPGAFLEAARRQLDTLGIEGEAGIPLARQEAHAGKAKRHVLRIKGRRLVGYGLQVTGLTAEASIQLQEAGLGGKRKMGCGFFVPIGPRNRG